jgi:3-deoxy-D-manno-octulosonate 8-phosphate phosphatase (KDO 8-P phosphatase)
MQFLAPEQFDERARALRLVVSDNDGVLTDTGVYYSARGEELKRYSIRDGMGVERLRAAGVETGIITGELSENLKHRARKLQITHLWLGVKDKRALLDDVLRAGACTEAGIAYIGDDVNDIAVMEALRPFGLVAAPGDAMPAVRAIAHYVCAARGGNGAFREFAEAILAARRPG